MISETLFFLTNIDIEIVSVELPLGISFFTFLQIAYLVDKYRQQSETYSFSSYFLFVTFFPHLIAGPLVHHSKLIPQFSTLKKIKLDNLSVGIFIFSIGLFKKIIIVGEISKWSDNLFDGSVLGLAPSFIDSWIGVISFSLQIYFDFSAYSDMAIGLSKMIGIKLPINFNSPYKSISLIEFWKRWHITLSTFLKEYLYFSIGGNRKGVTRQYINIVIVMFFAGLWHGSSWLFVLWGTLHGLLLVINHMIRNTFLINLNKVFTIPFIFMLVTILWVPFRAETYDSMLLIFKGLIGLNGYILPFHFQEKFTFIHNLSEIKNLTFSNLNVYAGKNQFIILVSLILWVWILPNTQQITAIYKPVIDKIEKFYYKKFSFSFNTITGIICGILYSCLLIFSIQGTPGEFIYFQF
jgi:D-alanyl-lipoteichoic acid acyltransferase DltB (MBOAT superfamily)